MRSASVVDLFCGVGGMTHGFVREGFRVIAGIDSDATCKYPFEKNNGAKFIHRDIQKIELKEIADLYPRGDLKILIGCAPCQPFSKYSNRKSGSEDDKWKLLLYFAELIRSIKPEIVSMENVPELKTHSVFKKFLKALEDEQYHVYWKLINCLDYGVPQTRVRLVLLASKLGEIRMIRKTHPNGKTVAQVIRGLERIKAGEVSRKDSLHRSSELSEMNLRRIKNTPPGGGWRDWPDELVLKCHKAKTGKTYRNVYGRMNWNAPAPTITTQCYGLGNGRFGHPKQNRAISLREAALLQTFPKSYKFVEPKSEVFVKLIGRHIGNAVPVRLGRVIARSIRRHLEVFHG